ncbi:plant UBX domain-containing protein 8 [Iris pallida]|uniref:Plant UBX domain-containing protein 8 n=1 Tax=Iris pallida TaxID=29817 RepID=A0AAX6EDU9_IRIPA|nr:plant UBX domain-containing protein 8 [Iris pallida]
MASPSQDAIDTFVSITGASESTAIHMLQEHGGDLNAAVDAHFNEGDRQIVHAPSFPALQNDFMNIDVPMDAEPQVPSFPLLAAAARDLNPFALLNSRFGERFLDSEGANGFSSHEPRVSHPKDVRVIPIEFKDGNDQPSSSGIGPIIEDVTESTPAYGPEVHGDVIIVDEDEDLPSATVDRSALGPADAYFGKHSGPAVTPPVNVTVYNNDIEEEMILAAIEASKRDVEESARPQFDVLDGSNSSQLEKKLPTPEEDELAHAVSLSMKTAEQERALRELGVQKGEQSSNLSGKNVEDVGRVTTANWRQGFVTSNTGTSGKSVIEDDDPSDQEEAEDVEEEPLIRHRSGQIASGILDAQVVNSPASSPQRQENGNHQPNGDAFPSDEWGGISSEEHDEAVMIEAAMFGGIPEGSSYNFAYPPHVLQSGSDRNSNLYPRVPRPPSPTLTAQRLLREQQDDEYLAALQADREKELKATQEEVAAREAALEREKYQEEEARRKLMEEEEFERKLSAKQASLPQEPSSEDENSVSLLIRMPDGSRCGRRFLKSDKLQFLFDYIDVGRLVKPGSYRLVRPYPRQAFTNGESASTLAELGLTSKQEALFLELI